jgi:hypothetical protein
VAIGQEDEAMTARILNVSALLMMMVLTSAIPGYAMNLQSNSGRLMRGAEFCARLAKTVSVAAQHSGSSRSEAERLSRTFAQNFIETMNTGRVEPYLSRNVQVEDTNQDKISTWFSASDLILNSVGFKSERVMLLETVNDLRFVPHIMPKSHVVLMADHAGDLNKSRQEMIVSTVTALGGRVHVIWHGSRQDGEKLAQAKILARISLATGGVFVDLSDMASCRSH